jgi:hypothetical protein
MLNEAEYAEILGLYGDAMKSTKEFRERWNLPLENISIHQRFQPVRERYEHLTGMKDCHQNAILHHRLSLNAKSAKNLCVRLRPSFAEVAWPR